MSGVAFRLGLTFDQTEDLQRALEAVFAQPAASDTLTVTLAPSPVGLLVSAGPIVAGPNERPGLERVLATLVDEVTLDEADRNVWISMRLSCGPVATASR